MRFKIPQDVQREDKILGPLTLKQFIMAVVGVSLCWFFYSLVTIEIAIPIIIVIAVLTLCFVFVKIHEMPFYEFLMNIILYALKPRVRIWNKSSGDLHFLTSRQPPPAKKTDKKKEGDEALKPKKSIDELANILDSRGRIDDVTSGEESSL